MLVVGHCGPGSDLFFLFFLWMCHSLACAGLFTGWYVQSSLGMEWRSVQPPWTGKSPWSMSPPFKNNCFETLLASFLRKDCACPKLTWEYKWRKVAVCTLGSHFQVVPAGLVWESVPLTQLLSLVLGCWTHTEHGLLTSRFVKIIQSKYLITNCFQELF